MRYIDVKAFINSKTAVTVLAVVLYWLLTSLVVGSAISLAGGRLVYPLDDTYIQMAIARHTVESRTWGVTPYGFSSSSSSPLWVFLLVLAYLAVGIVDAVPLVLNLIFGTILILVMGAILGNLSRGTMRFVALILAIVVVPLPMLALLGMEHTLQALLMLLFVFGVARLVGAGAAPNPKLDLAMLVTAPLAVAVRYESLFAVFLAALLLAFRGRWRFALLLCASSLTLVGAYGVWLVANGWPPVPIPVLLKGNRPEPSLLGILSTLAGLQALTSISSDSLLFAVVVLMLASLLAGTDRVRSWTWRQFSVLLTCGTAILHAQFGRFDSFFRYEAYLLVLAVTFLGSSLESLLQAAVESSDRLVTVVRAGLLFALLLVVGAPFGLRAGLALRGSTVAASEIYQQQWQVSAFLQRYYPEDVVAVNDIGVVGYQTRVRILDLWGLANKEVALSKLDGLYDQQHVGEIIDRAQPSIAIVYDRWFQGTKVEGILSKWTRVGQWRSPTGVVLGDPVVSFYAVRADQHQALLANLRAFSRDVPPNVVQTGEYMQTPSQ